MFTAPEVSTRVGRMLIAGNVTITVTDNDSHEHITIRFKCIADNRDRSFNSKSTKNWIPCRWEDATHVFAEVPSQGDWADKVGTYYPRTGRWFRDDNADNMRVGAARAAAAYACGLPLDLNVVCQEEERCGVCSRQLTDPLSITRGIGPECYGKLTESQHQIKHVKLDDLPVMNPLPLKGGGTIAEQRETHDAEVAVAQKRSASMADLVSQAIIDAAGDDRWTPEQWENLAQVTRAVADKKAREAKPASKEALTR